MAITTVALIAAAIITNTDDAALADGDNAAQHAAVCRLIKIATSEPLLRPIPARPTQAIDDVFQTNMSLAPEAWVSLFIDETNKPIAWEDKFVTEKKYPKEWQQSWNAWAAAAEQIRQNDKKKQVLEKAGLDKISEHELAAARAALINVAATVDHLANDYDSLVSKLAPNPAAKIKEKLNSAAYGTAQGKANYADDTAAAKISQAATCEAGAKVDATQTLMQTIICLCTTDTGGTPKTKACIKEKVITAAWQTHSDNMATQALANILKTCGKAIRPGVSAEAIRSALHQVHAMIVPQDDNSGILGSLVSGTCTGSDTRGMCVRYKGYVAGDNDKFSEIQWAADLAGAADMIQANDDVAAQATRLVEAINTAAKQTATTARAAQVLTAVYRSVVSGLGNNTKPKQDQTAGEQEKVCTDTAKKTATECKSLGCDFDEKESKCKPKTGTENTAAGAGQATNTEGKKCSEKTKQEDCKSPDCKLEGET